MAIHTQQPIYKAALDLTCLSSRLVAHMPRNHRAVDGARLVGCSREILIHVRLANLARDREKIPHIDQILARADDVDIELRICKELELISISNFSKAAELQVSVSKQAAGWKKASASRPVSQSSR